MCPYFTQFKYPHLRPIASPSWQLRGQNWIRHQQKQQAGKWSCSDWQPAEITDCRNHRRRILVSWPDHLMVLAEHGTLAQQGTQCVCWVGRIDLLQCA